MLIRDIRILTINLDRKRSLVEVLSQDQARQWLSGRALNVALLYRHLKGLPAPIDPFSPDNPLILSSGILVGSAAPSAARLHLNAVSPLTGMLASSNIGGRVATRLKSCGFDGIIVTGASTRPVFIEIDTDGASVRDASVLWGLDVHTAHDRLATLSGDDAIESLVIGPGGENGCRFACVVTDQDHAAGRTGLGAVMGAKNLKALVIRKPASPVRSFVQPDRTAVREYVDAILHSPDFKAFSKLGGAGYVAWAGEKGLLSTRNYSDTRFSESRAIDGSSLTPAIRKSRGCSGCPVRCKAVLEFTRGRLKGKVAFRPEFEPMINLGAKCGLGDTQAVVFLDNLCTSLGIDSTSASTAIAFAMDLSGRGLLTSEATGGLALAWGDAGVMETLIRQMAAMQGFGGLLGMGVRHAAETLGQETRQYAAHVKGLELTAYHPAALLGTALGYAVSSRGGDYNNVYASLEHRWTPDMAKKAFGTAKALDPASFEGKGRLVHRAVLVNCMVDSLGICKVPALSMVGTFDLVPEAALTSAVTGWDLSADDLFARAEVTAFLERAINIRQGATPEDDSLPDMFFENKSHSIDRSRFQTMVQDFYAAMGWDASGRPDPGLLEQIETTLPVFAAENPDQTPVLDGEETI